jgi:hypothetical protein
MAASEAVRLRSMRPISMANHWPKPCSVSSIVALRRQRSHVRIVSGAPITSISYEDRDQREKTHHRLTTTSQALAHNLRPSREVPQTVQRELFEMVRLSLHAIMRAEIGLTWANEKHAGSR